MEQIIFGMGAIPDPIDGRDHIYEKALGAAPIDWVKGYDIRQTLGDNFAIKNQFSSSSCVGQGTSYYAWIKNIRELMADKQMNLKELKEKHSDLVDAVSAKAVYSQISLGANQGAYIRDGVKLIVDYGALFESDVKSYKSDGSTDEAFMIDTLWKNAALTEKARTLRAKEYKMVEDRMIDTLAMAILQGDGVLGGVYGSNNGSWSTANPLPPKSEDGTWWAHCVYFGAFGTDEKGKFIATPNSWGALWGDWDGTVGSGWQKLRENYCNKTVMFNPWTLIDKDNDLAAFNYTFTKDLFPNISENDIPEVKALQTLLRILGYYNDPMNTYLGYFGSVTEGAVKDFQAAQNIAVTGKVDQATREKLNLIIN